MKKLILSAIFSTLAFVVNAQTKIVNVYQVAIFSKDTLTSNPYDVIKSASFIGDTIEISKRFVINFLDSTFIEYVDGEIVSQGTIQIIRELIGNGFHILLLDSNNITRGINSYLSICQYFEQRDNITYVEQFENFSKFFLENSIFNT